MCCVLDLSIQFSERPCSEEDTTEAETVGTLLHRGTGEDKLSLLFVTHGLIANIGRQESSVETTELRVGDKLRES